MRWTKRWARRLRTVLRRDAVERELDEEMTFHFQMEVEKNVRAGMAPAEARRRAGIAFGGVEKFKEEVRDARAFGWVSGLSLDLKLGLRMLRRYPGLTLVGGLAMTFAIAAGAASFELVTQLMNPRIPVAEGGRLIGIQNWDAGTSRVDWRTASELRTWREQLRSVEELGAFHGMQRNLVVRGGSAEPVRGVEMSASGFRLAQVPPLLGRYLLDTDERDGAPPVVVLDHALWQGRFGGDPHVVGTQVRLGSVVHTVVGVMPREFGFPFSQQVWTPLRLRPQDMVPGEGPELRVFGRLAPGSSLGDAQAEVALLSRRAALASPETHARIRSRVLPYSRSVMDLPWSIVSGAAYGTNVGVLMFLLLVCANVATLIFARTATRETELVVRTALGASRRRIVLQLFAEAMVLGSAAAVIGLVVAALGMRWGLDVFETVTGELPFWIVGGLSLRTIAYAALLAVLAAAVAGVVPALKMTGKGAEQRLRQAAVGGSSLRFGRLWTGIIIVQVAVTAAAFPLILDVGMDTSRIRAADIGFPASEYLSARVRAEEAPPGTAAQEPDLRFRNSFTELERRLEEQPGVIAVTHARQLPGAYHVRRRLEVEGGSAPPKDEAEHRIQTAQVATDFFDVLGARVLAGRGFRPADLGEGSHAVVVNESFGRRVLGGRNPVGRRFRYTDDEDAAEAPATWYEIVGVVSDMTLTVDPDLPHNAGIYHPVVPEAGAAEALLVHTRGDPEAFAPRLRAVATAVDPALQLHQVRLAERSTLDILLTYQFWVRIAYIGCGIVLLLSILGIYSILSFTVARRTREIGIRVALGASRWGVLRPIFVQTFTQVGLGTAGGILLLVLLAGGIHSARGLALLAAGAGLMALATAAAGFLPTRRALGVQPIEAMRSDG